MSVVQTYLWVCAAIAVGVSLALGSAVLLAGAGRKGGANFSPWPLVAAVSGTLMCLQIGYLTAPLAVRAGSEWWQWTLAAMVPPALVSLFSLWTNLWRLAREGVVCGRRVSVRPWMVGALVLQGAVYLGAPLVLWLARGPLGN